MVVGYNQFNARKQDGRYTTTFIQMGARVYIPSLGRFLQVDPVDGGTLNGYVYVADPINGSDYNGQWGWGDLFSAIVNVVKAVIKAIVTPIAAVVKAVVSFFSPPKAAASSARGPAPAPSSSSSRASGSASTVSAKVSRPTTVLGPGGTDIFDIKNTAPKSFKSGPSFDLKSLIPPAGYSWGGLGKTVGGGCTATGLLFMGIAGLPGAPVTAGMSIPAAAGAGCASGAVGGLVTYLLIGDANVQDTGIASDAYGELMNRYR
jgi:RHS repeat-associated protein